MQRSHVFVVQGDLTAVRADFVLVPADSRLLVEAPWSALLPSHARRTTTETYSERCRLVQATTSATSGVRFPTLVVTDLALLPDSTVAPADEVEPALQYLLCGVGEALDAVAMRLQGSADERRSGTESIAGSSSSANGKQARPLLSLPIVGTGKGGLRGNRGAVIKALVGMLEDRVEGLPCDVVLVCWTRSDYEAVQSVRAPSPLPWTSMAHKAFRDLKDDARRGSLAVLFGAGASAALGQPTWSELLDELATRSGRQADLGDLSRLDPVDAAAILSDSLDPPGSGLQRALRAILSRKGCTLTHALMASMRPTVALTTNYDTGYETALDSVLGNDDPRHPAEAQVRVLPWDTVLRQDMPRVVKLHGDLRRGSIVLSRQQFVEMHAFRRPLTALLQERLLTGKVLALGTSFSDSTLTQAVFEVTALRRALKPGSRQPSLGVFLMTEGDPARRALLHDSFRTVTATALMRPFGDQPSDVRDSARRIDIFLDELGRRAGSGLGFLADPRYLDLVEARPHLKRVADAITALAAELGSVSDGRALDETESLYPLRTVLAQFGAYAER